MSADNTMDIAVNGDSYSFLVTEVSTIYRLLVRLEYIADTGEAESKKSNEEASAISAIAVARNQVIVPRQQYQTTQLNHGDRIDILGAITGG